MGYTHYWYRPSGEDVPQATWDKIVAGSESIIKQAVERGIDVAWESDAADRAPDIGPDTIRFNGVGDGGHETFLVDRKCEEQPSHRAEEANFFSFCKTARKPYDEVVVSILSLMSNYLPDWDFETDGDADTFSKPSFRPN